MAKATYKVVREIAQIQLRNDGSEILKVYVNETNGQQGITRSLRLHSWYKPGPDSDVKNPEAMDSNGFLPAPRPIAIRLGNPAVKLTKALIAYLKSEEYENEDKPLAQGTKSAPVAERKATPAELAAIELAQLSKAGLPLETVKVVLVAKFGEALAETLIPAPKASPSSSKKGGKKTTAVAVAEEMEETL